MDETILSKIIHGYRNPTPAQRKLLASHLGADETWLFEPFEDVRARRTPQTARLAAEEDAGEDGAH